MNKKIEAGTVIYDAVNARDIIIESVKQSSGCCYCRVSDYLDADITSDWYGQCFTIRELENMIRRES